MAKSFFSGESDTFKNKNHIVFSKTSALKIFIFHLNRLV